MVSDPYILTDWEQFASNYDTQATPVINTPTSLPTGFTGNAYSQTLSAIGGTPPYHWSASSGSLPPGLTVYDNGTLTGTPTAGGYYPPVVTVTDSTGVNASANLRLTVLDFALTQPSAVSLVQAGASTAVTITSSTPTGLSGQLTLSSTPPTGIGLQLSTSSISIGGSFTATVSAPFQERFRKVPVSSVPDS